MMICVTDEQTPRSTGDDRTIDLGGGVRMPLIGLGTWQLRGEQGYRAVRFALDAGYRHIDTATMYANEAEVGRALRDSGLPRGDVFVTTKLWPDGAGRERDAIAKSLAALGTDYVDLWLVHWPPGGRPAPRTWQEFLAVRDEGRARAVGVSNYSVGQIDQLTRATGETPAVNQIPWGPRRHDPVELAELRERAVVVEGYSPFKNAKLREPVLVRIADAHGVSVPQVIIRWHLAHRIVVIPKSAKPDRITANLDVFDFTLSPEEVNSIDALPGG
jgi:2,5-diketo-D-gluconate reductase A